jgi:hypothetical protein
MKTILQIFLTCVCIVLMGCEPNAPAFKKVVTGDAINITDYSAQLPGTLNVDPKGYGHLYYGIVIA